MGKTSVGVSVPKRWLKQMSDSMDGQPVKGVMVEQVGDKLVLSACFKMKERKIPSKRKVSVPVVQPQPEPSPKHTYYLCSCGTEFDAHEKWVSHIRGTSHYLKDEITR